jgi:ABC-2 type transport system ATP-binding protein
MTLAPNNGYVIQTQGLTKNFGEVQAIKDLDLKVPKNAIVGFLGPNGAGKSTTIRLLLGLNRPNAGSGQIFGMDITKDSLNIRRRVGYLAQQPHFYKDMTARQILDYTARFFFSGPKSGIDARVEEMLVLVELEDKADRPVRGFSGGERQRLGIAQAQINNPELLILDEPAAALDPMGRLAVLRIMERLRQHATIFYSTHILDDVQRVSDHVIILNQGKLIAQGSIEHLLQQDNGTLYNLVTQGQDEGVESVLQNQPWVSNVTLQQRNGANHWRIAINDEKAAQEKLLRLVLADQKVKVLSYGPETHELEDFFIQLVNKESH